MKNSKFDFYDIVKVCSERHSLRKINGFEGVISGKAQNEETGRWGYAVDIYHDPEGWHIMEEDLISTGKRANPEDYRPVATVRVRVNPETGEGEIIDGPHDIEYPTNPTQKRFLETGWSTTSKDKSKYKKDSE